MKHSPVVLAACSIALWVQPIAFAATAKEEASQLYGQRKYAEAATKFADIVRQNPTNAEAAYYAAYASYQAGKRTDALELFWYVVKKCPTSKYAFNARDILKKIDTDYARHTADSKLGSLPSPVVTGAKPIAPIVVEDKNALVESLVKLTPRRSNRPDVTPAFVAEIKDGLKQFSVPVLKFLLKNDCHIIISPCVVEADFRMQGYTPGGYWEGATMEDVPALFDFHNIVVGQYLPDHRGGYINNDGILGTLRHEIGHAIDKFSGNLSEREDFKHARVWDYPSSNQRGLLAYFIGGRRGNIEAFAELCAYKFGGRTDKNREQSCSALQKSSKRSWPIVERYIDKLEAGEPL